MVIPKNIIIPKNNNFLFIQLLSQISKMTKHFTTNLTCFVLSIKKDDFNFIIAVQKIGQCFTY